MQHESFYLEPAWRIAKAVCSGEITARDVAEIFNARIESINPIVSAWKHLDQDYFFQQAEYVDDMVDKGRLAGVPIGVKDIFNTEGYPTEMGSVIWKGHKAGNDARCVSYLRQDGGVIAGKTDTAEFAVHTPGNALNPWNTKHVTGTSSGGSAVAVATAMVPVALATQTAGSTLRPASWCGVYGMKPSFGMVPRTGVLKTTDTLDNIGFYGRTVPDLRLLLDSMRVSGHNFPIMEKGLSDYRNKPILPWRVGFVRGHLWEHAPEYTKQAMVTLVKKMTNVDDIEVVEIELPEITRHVHELHRRIYNPCLAYYFCEELEKSPEKISDSFMDLVEDGKTISPDDYSDALSEQSLLSRKLEEQLDKLGIDVLLMHSSNGAAPKGDEPKINQDLNLLWTVAWMPVINVPSFFSPEGLPFGFQVIGKRYSDYRLFDFIEKLVTYQIAPEIAPVAELKNDVK